MSQKYYVYIHARPDTNDVHGIFYVGKGNTKRVNSLHRKRNPHHVNIVKKYGVKSIIVRKLLCESEQHAFELEIQIIAILRRMNVNLVNLTNGGEGLSGYVTPPESRLKISNAMKKIQGNQETREKLSKTMKIVKGTPEARAKQSETSKKIKGTLEARAKMSAKMKEVKGTPESRLQNSNAIKKAKGTPEAKAKISATSKRAWENENSRAKVSQSIKSVWNDEEYKANQLAIRTSKEFREKQSIASKLAWERRKAKIALNE